MGQSPGLKAGDLTSVNSVFHLGAIKSGGFPGSSAVKNSPANAGDLRDAGLIPGSGRSPGEGHGNPLQYSCLENPTDRGAWQVAVYRVAQSWTRLKRHSMQAHHHPRNKEEDPFSAVARPGEERGNVPSLWEDTTLPSGSPSLRRKVNAAQGLKRLSHRLLGSWEVGSTLSHSPCGWAKAKGSWGSHLEGASPDPDRNQNGSGSLPQLGAYSRQCQPFTLGEFFSQAQSGFLQSQ